MTILKVDPQTFFPLHNVHARSKCVGTGCALHHPGRHPLNTSPLYWDNADKMMFRECLHKKLHPDVDAVEREVYKGKDRQTIAEHACCTGECCRWHFVEVGWETLGRADNRFHAMEIVELLGVKRDDWRWDGISGEILVHRQPGS